jgi:TatD DNase family protein
MPYITVWHFLLLKVKQVPYIDIHTHRPDETGTISIFNAGIAITAKSKYVSTGIHPWHIRKSESTVALETVRNNSSLQHVLAIGECGLDKFADSSMDEQERIFTEQIRIAEEIKKPLIIHCVKAFDSLIRIKKKSRTSIPFIVHGYNNNEETAAQLFKSGFILSFGKALLKDGSNAQKVIRQTVPEHFLLETDDADISIKSIFEKAAELKNINVEELKEKMMLNFKTIFGHE